MNHPLNLTDIKLELDDVNSKLANISAKEVLFIVFLSIIAIVSLLNLLLMILERRKKSQQNTVPQAIVIQPNGGAGGGSGDKKSKSEKSKISAHSEKDVVPSRSMKVKIAIAPGQQSNRKAQSREILGEDISNVRLPKLENVATQNVVASKKDVDNSCESNNLNSAAPQPLPPQPQPQIPLSQQPSFTDHQRAERADSLVNVAIPSAPAPTTTNAANSKISVSTDSMTSFTVPEDGRSNTSQPNSAHVVPGGQGLNTPSATTLSGNTADNKSSELSSTVSKNTAIEPAQVTTPTTAGPPLVASSAAPTTTEKDPKKI